MSDGQGTNSPQPQKTKGKKMFPKLKKPTASGIAILASIASLILSIYTTINTGSSTKLQNAQITQVVNQINQQFISMIQTETAMVVAPTHAENTQEAISAADARTQTALADEVDFTPKYFCSNTANIDTRNDEDTTIQKWADHFHLDLVIPITTSYWIHAKEVPDRDYLFLAFLNRRTWVKITGFSKAIWEDHQHEPDGWNEANVITSQEKMEDNWAYILLVADRPKPPTMPSSPALPPGSSDSPDLPSNNVPLPNQNNSAGAEGTDLFFDCGELTTWGTTQVSFELTLDPDNLAPGPYTVSLREGGLVTQLLQPLQ
jgi:hypothetical protein